MFLRRVLVLLLPAALFLGCKPSPSAKSSATNGSSETATASTSEDSSSDAGTSETAKAENAGPKAPLLEPFDAPPLAELEKSVEWEDRPVVDPNALKREFDAKQKQLVSVEEALKMKNQTAEDNNKILSALGRLPTEKDKVDEDATIVRLASGDVKSTNPLMMNSTIEFDVIGLIGPGLFGFDWEMKPLALSETVVSWQTSKDMKYDKVVMRNDLTWSDGKPITAYDVEFSFQTIMNPEVPVWAVRSGTDQLRWVKAYDEQTLVYFHKAPLATNVWNISFPMIPKHIYEKSVQEDPTMQASDYHINLENNPICGGAYKLVKRNRGQEIVLERREDYYMHNGKQVREKPYFKEIRFLVIEDPNTGLLAMKKGTLDEMSVTAEQWKTQTDGEDFYNENTKATGLEWVTFHIMWNTKTPYFSDKRVRKAMSYAFDHKEMLSSIFYGLYQPSAGIFHPTAWMASSKPKPYTQDLDKAEELLDEAGWSDSDGDGVRDKKIGGRSVRFEFTVLTNTTPNGIKVATLLKESLDRIGIICNVKPLEYTVLQQMEKDHKFQAAFGGWGTGTDPDTGENLWKTGEERNFGQYSNPEVDRLFAAGKKEFDRTKRAAIYAKIHELTWEDQPYTWLFIRNSFYGFDKKLRGYQFSPRGPFNYNPGFSAMWAADQ